MIESLKNVTRYYPNGIGGMWRGKHEGTPVYVKLSDVVVALRSTSTNKQNVPLEYEEWAARPCNNYDSCPVKNKNLHCYANKPCFS